MAGKIPQVITGDAKLNQIQQNIAKTLKQVLDFPIPDGAVLFNVKLIAGSPNAIPHNLGRNIQGWFLVRLRAQAIIWDSQDSNPNPTSTLILQTSSNATVDIWVY